MKPLFTFSTIATMALPLLVACGATTSQAGHSMAQIMETIEKGDFTCEQAERHPKKFAEVGSCQSNQHEYQKLIINRWNDQKARDQMYEHRIPTMCRDLGMKDQVRWSTSDSWTLVAGGSTEGDVKALDEACFTRHFSDCEAAAYTTESIAGAQATMPHISTARTLLSTKCISIHNAHCGPPLTATKPSARRP